MTTIDSKSNSLFHAINKLAATSDSGDKETSIYQEALSVALAALNGNDKALSNIAKAVKTELGNDIEDISYMDCESEINLLTEVISTSSISHEQKE